MEAAAFPPRSLSYYASYLGLTTETVSRTFSSLHGDGLINIMPDSVLAACDPYALKGLADGLR
jgi:Bacterial regulatory proteins, crp family